MVARNTHNPQLSLPTNMEVQDERPFESRKIFPAALLTSLKILGISPISDDPTSSIKHKIFRYWQAVIVCLLNLFTIYCVFLFLANAVHNCEVLIETMHFIQGLCTALTVNVMLLRRQQIIELSKEIAEELGDELVKKCHENIRPYTVFAVCVFWCVGLTVLSLDVIGNSELYSNGSCKALSEPDFVARYHIHSITDIFAQNYLQNGIYALMLIPLTLCIYIKQLLIRLGSSINVVHWELAARPAEIVRRIGADYYRTQRLVVKFNQVFSPLILLWMFLFFVTFAMRGGSFIGDIQAWQQNGGITVMIICSVITIAILMITIWIFASINDETRQVVAELSPLLYIIPPSDREFHWKLQLLMTLLFFQPCAVTAWDMFTVTRGLALTLSGALCTYALLIIQFYIPAATLNRL